jgi:hypothetical protein
MWGMQAVRLEGEAPDASGPQGRPLRRRGVSWCSSQVLARGRMLQPWVGTAA